jgi:ABC-type antimicrobial peptide transport system permease subunit
VLPIYALTAAMPLSIPGLPAEVTISSSTMFTALTVAVACGLLASIVPAWMAGRLQVAPALRKVV